MKKRELYELQEGLEKVHQSGNKFCYVVTKNKRKIDAEIRKMEKDHIEPDEKYKEFLIKLEDLRKKYAEKDEKGRPVKKQGQNVNGKPAMYYDIKGIGDAESPFMKEVAVMEKKYKEHIEKHQEKEMNYWNTYLDEETELVLHPINLNNVPENITQGEMDGIFGLIIE